MTDLLTITGFEFETEDQARDYYNTHKPPGAPEYTTGVLPYLRGLHGAGTWEELVERSTHTKEIVDRSENWFRAIYPQNEGDLRDTFPIDEDGRERMDEVLRTAQDEIDIFHGTEIHKEVFLRWVGMLPTLNLVAANHAADTAEWHWAKVRCFLAGAGYSNHKTLARRLQSQYPNCDLIPSETKDEWKDNLLAAHKLCGWPVQLSHVSWGQLTWACTFEDADATIVHPWMKAVALLHVLKHMRYSERHNCLVTVYKGVSLTHALASTTNAVVNNQIAGAAMKRALGVRKAPKGMKHPISEALSQSLLSLTTKDLLNRRSLIHTPGNVLAGAWSTLVPDATEGSGFVQHGCRLNGVWLAHKGNVRDTHGDADDIMRYDWNVVDPHLENNIEERERFAHSLPNTYTEEFPYEVLGKAFPNLDISTYSDPDAAKVMFDLPIVSSLLRYFVPELAYEFPLVIFLPKSPTFDESTNQGKTLAALSYGRCLVPDIQVVGALDSSSAPDVRTLSTMIRTRGTVVLDEWRQPRSRSHILCHENMQMLCTGGTVSAGQVYENNGAVRLLHSLVVAAKALAFPPDLVNRSFVWTLDVLDDVARNDADTLSKLRNGQTSTRARLGALGLIEKYGLARKLLDAAKTSSTDGIRFEAHRALANMLYEIRTGRSDPLAVDRAYREMKTQFVDHANEASDNGVMASLNQGESVRLTMSDIFTDLPDVDVSTIQAQMEALCQDKGNQYRKDGFVSVSDLLRMRAEVSNLNSRSLAALLPELTGQHAKVSNRVVSTALLNDIKRRLKEGDTYPLPGHLALGGWVLERGNDQCSMVRVRLVRNEAGSPEDLMSAIDPANVQLD